MRKGKGARSIITDNLEYCAECSALADDIHHCIHGISSNKKRAEEFGLMIPLCRKHHDMVHFKASGLDAKYKAIAQEKFEEHYPDLDFMKIFGRSFK